MSDPRARIRPLVPRPGRTTERTFYPELINEIVRHGGSGVSEVNFNASPDIVFDFENRDWLLGVRIGEAPATLKDAFLQYERHREESGKKHGILLFLPDQARAVRPVAAHIAAAVRELDCSVLIDAPGYHDQLKLPFPRVLESIRDDIIPSLVRREYRPYPASTILSFLREHVVETMDKVQLSDPGMLRVITDKKLLSGIGHISTDEATTTSRFLATYIIVSQVLFLRLFSRNRPEVLPPDARPVTRAWLRSAFQRVLNINYRPIFKLDVLDLIPQDYIRDTFDLIWKLEVEGIRYELPGRIFHELMPPTVRKMLAAFYTRPESANLLARLTITGSNESVFDPACGSGTILVSAYRRKKRVMEDEGRGGNPHEQFCERELFGSDIMPFAVHLTTANLASMDPATTIRSTQIIRQDSLRLSRGRRYPSGTYGSLIPPTKTAHSIEGEEQEVKLDKVDVVLMNPPFTKVERGISSYVEMERFAPVAGREVGLWGHFVFLADDFLSQGGSFGGVLPINLLRGRESARVREFMFSDWTPLYIVKPTANYAFSESAEYRDVLFVARKGAPPPGHKLKVALVKKDLTALTSEDVAHFGNQIEASNELRTPVLDVASFTLDEMKPHFQNLMRYCASSDLKIWDVLNAFANKFHGALARPPAGYFREGYGPRPKGVSSFLFLTRSPDESRSEEAFLTFTSARERAESILARSPEGVFYRVEKTALTPSLRTGVGLTRMGTSEDLDYIARAPYRELDRVLRAAGFRSPRGFSWPRFWKHLNRELASVRSKVVTLNRINPYSDNTQLIAFCSSKSFSAANTLNVVREEDETRAKAFCVLVNSAAFLSQFFLLKEESTGRYIHIRFYDLYEMDLYPTDEQSVKLASVFDEYSSKRFPALRDQLDADFQARYNEYWQKQRRGQRTLVHAGDEVRPSPLRLAYDMSVCAAIGVPVTDDELGGLYGAIVQEMIHTRGLRRD